MIPPLIDFSGFKEGRWRESPPRVFKSILEPHNRAIRDIGFKGIFSPIERGLGTKWYKISSAARKAEFGAFLRLSEEFRLPSGFLTPSGYCSKILNMGFLVNKKNQEPL